AGSDMSSGKKGKDARSGRLGFVRLGEMLIGMRWLEQTWVRVLVGLAAGFLLAIAIVTPLELKEQLLFGVAAFALALWLRRQPGRLASLVLVVFSVTVSLRYMYWRVTSTLGFDTALDMFFGYGLLLAE